MRSGANFSYILQIDDRRTVNAQEHLRVEPLFDVRHGFAEKVRLRAGADADVVFFRGYPANIGDGEKQDAAARFEDHPSAVMLTVLVARFAVGCIAPRGIDLFARALHRRAETVGGERLEQIVDCTNIECPNRVVIIRGSEDDRWDAASLKRRQFVDYTEAVQSGHANVEEEKVRRRGADQVNGFVSSCTFAYDLYFKLIA